MSDLCTVIMVALLEYARNRHWVEARWIRRYSSAWLTHYIKEVLFRLHNILGGHSKIAAGVLLLPLVIVPILLKSFLTYLLGEVGAILGSLSLFLYCMHNTDVLYDDVNYVSKHEQLFGLIFWQAICSSAGCVMYWGLQRLTLHPQLQETQNKEIHGCLTQVHGIAAWAPARLTGFIYSLVGNFATGFQAWKQCVTQWLPSSQVLTQCGDAAAGVCSSEEKTQFIHRATLMWFVMVMLFLLIK